MEIITQQSLFDSKRDRIKNIALPSRADMIDIVEPCMNLKANPEEQFKIAESAVKISDAFLTRADDLKTYGSAFDIPQPCMTLSDKKNTVVMSVREMVNKGVFMSSNTLPADWQTLWDAMRIDISIAKAALGTIRENIYNVQNMPNSSRVYTSTEFFPYGIVFTENNGEGQSVKQGETRGGQVEYITNKIYSAGFTWTLLAELFEGSIDMQKLSDALAVGYNAKRDDLALLPIIEETYASAAKTAANTTSDADRQELLYLTLEDAIDDLGKRKDPVTKRRISTTGLVILANPTDATHIARVISGLPSTNEKKYGAITEISKVLGYDGETIDLRAETVEYTGVTEGTCYLIKPNRYMNIGVKRSLTAEIDRTPDVTKLIREQRGYYFVEGTQNESGIDNFIQEITLPTW